MTDIPSTDEDRLVRAAQEYQDALEAGEKPDRAVFLARHSDLAGELDGYLDALEALNGATSEPPAEIESLPTSVPLGDFQIIREIGRGGMGVVYEARQLSLGRRVAVKVLPFAAALDERQLQRFKNEAQAAAQLHHTHIVPVYAVGCDRGVHFYAMQLIDGRTLAEMIDELRNGKAREPDATTAVAAATFRSSLGQGAEHYRDIARLMVQAAEALEHAHEQGVIHRDVKPANLLVDARGHLWVTDFGLAQFAAGVDLTRTGDLLGTLRYMSPEQASGRRVVLDQRTDVYSLGATFYELLSLQSIFEGTSRPELLRQIEADEPKPPRAIRKTIPHELETIVLKCLGKMPGDRYATARELADDLQRFLAHEPIRARRPGIIDRTRKWMRRHPGVLACAGVVLLVSTILLLINQATVTTEQGRTRDALDQLTLEQQRTKGRAEQAERRLKQTRRLADLLIQIGEEELDDRPQLQGLRRRLLETALAHYQELVDDSADNAEASAELAAARERVRELLGDLLTLQDADHLMLLMSDPVLDELRPSREQRQQIKDRIGGLNRTRLETVSSRELTPAQKRERNLEQARAGQQAIAALLNDEQAARLKQVALQMKGLMAFRQSDVGDHLALTSKQKQQIRDIEGDLFKPPGGDGPRGPEPGGRRGDPGGPREGPGGRPGGGPGGRPGEGRGPERRPEDGFRDAMNKALAVLTPVQRKKWQELTGKPFEMPMRFGGPQRPFGPPPR